VPGALNYSNLVKREAELGRHFGYSPREVRGYVRRARAALASQEEAHDIANTDELARHLERLHEEITRGVSTEGRIWSRWRSARRAREEAEDRLFAVGVLVADSARRVLYDLSYAIAVMGLRQDNDTA
jgi:hypothetical protein